jgi:hypothetical protein
MTTAIEPAVTKHVYRESHGREQVWRAAYEIAGQRHELPYEWPLAQQFDAECALDQAVYDHLSRFPVTLAPEAVAPEEDLVPIDPTTPFAGGGPAAAWRPSAEQLQVACDHLRSYYPEGLVQGKKTLDIAGRVTKAQTALIERAWELLADGSLVIAGGKEGETYLVRDDTCGRVLAPLPDVDRADPMSWSPVTTTTKTGKKSSALCAGFLHGNICYHAMARELLRLSQVLAERDAVATMDARLLSGFLYAAQLAQQPVGWQVLPAGFVINAGGAHTVLPAETDGALTAEFSVPTESFAQFWDAFKPIARHLANSEERATAEVWLSPREGAVNITVDVLNFSYQLAA